MLSLYQSYLDFFKYGPKWGLDTFNFNIWFVQWLTEGLMFSLLLYNANQVSMLCEWVWF